MMIELEMTETTADLTLDSDLLEVLRDLGLPEDRLHQLSKELLSD